MKGMLGFRNVAIHEYQELNLKVVQDIIEQHLQDIQEFARAIIKIMDK